MIWVVTTAAKHLQQPQNLALCEIEKGCGNMRVTKKVPIHSTNDSFPMRSQLQRNGPIHLNPILTKNQAPQNFSNAPILRS